MHQQTVLRFGAGCAIAGALLAIVLNIVHPDITGGVNATREVIASHSDWRATHLGIMVSCLLLTCAFMALALLIARKRTSEFQWFGIVVIAVGAAVVMVAIGIDGYADKTLADLWSRASPADRPALLAAGDAIYLVHEGLFYVWAGLFFGVAYVFYGLALMQSQTYPTRFGQIAVAVGSAETLIAAVQFLVLNDALEIALRIVLFAATLWLLALGALMWRDARQSPPCSGTT